MRSFALLALLSLAVAEKAVATVPIYEFEVVNSFPHDPRAFTEGLFYLNGFLYESTGLENHSSIRKVRLEDGAVVQRIDISSQYFGEGIVNWQDHLVSLTWQSHVGFEFDLRSFKMQRQFHYEGEGWALTQDGKRLIMSDGTSTLRFLNPDTLAPIGQLQVTFDGQPVRNVNELEWVKGEILANIWETDWIMRIDPKTGEVTGLIDLTGILKPAERVAGPDSVLNGIAYDAKRDRLFVTGKNWPKLFEIRLHASGKSAGARSP